MLVVGDIGIIVYFGIFIEVFVEVWVVCLDVEVYDLCGGVLLLGFIDIYVYYL